MTGEASNAITEPGLRKLLAKGWHLIVLCHRKPEFRHTRCYGDWSLRVAKPDGMEEHRLVLSREPFDERRFSTLDTLAKFLAKYDFATGHIPFKAGGRTFNVPPASWEPD